MLAFRELQSQSQCWGLVIIDLRGQEQDRTSTYLQALNGLEEEVRSFTAIRSETQPACVCVDGERARIQQIDIVIGVAPLNRCNLQRSREV